MKKKKILENINLSNEQILRDYFRNQINIKENISL